MGQKVLCISLWILVVLYDAAAFIQGYQSQPAQACWRSVRLPEYSKYSKRRWQNPHYAAVRCSATPAAVRASFFSIPSVPDGEHELVVSEGRVPAWLRGTFFRNGPGLFSAGSQELRHLFDGYALLNKFDFRGDDTVTWRCRFLESDAFTSAASGKMKYHEFSTPVGVDLVSKAGGIMCALGGGITDNACVNVLRLDDGSMLALTESDRRAMLCLTLGNARPAGHAGRGCPPSWLLWLRSCINWQPE